MKASWWARLFSLLLPLVISGCNQQPASPATTNQTTKTPVSFIPDPPPGFILENAPVASRKEFEETRAEAERGDAKAQDRLGGYYYNGEVVTNDLEEAVKWFRKAAEQGFAVAQYNLGVCYGNGNGVAKDLTEAVNWWRKAADQGNAGAEFKLGNCYYSGEGVPPSFSHAVTWLKKSVDHGIQGKDLQVAAITIGVCYVGGYGVSPDTDEAISWLGKAVGGNLAVAQYFLAELYASGQGVVRNSTEAVKWYHEAAEAGLAAAQFKLGSLYYKGDGTARDYSQAATWFKKAAQQGDAKAQGMLGGCYAYGTGVPVNDVEAYKWLSLAVSHDWSREGFPQDTGDKLREEIAKTLNAVQAQMSREEIVEAQRLAAAFTPRPNSQVHKEETAINKIIENGMLPRSTGSGFFISGDGYLISNNHVVEGATQVRLVTSAGLISAKVVKVDAANDLALLKAEGRFAPLAIAASRPVKLGSTVTTVGFPNIGLQGFAPKFARGEIASLSGAGDDARYFQISVPVQPGNSGGALVDERGNVVGVVSAKLNAAAALSSSGSLPENVNYAVKSSYLLSFLESVPEVSAKLKEPNAKEMKFEDVVKSAQDAAVLVLVY